MRHVVGQTIARQRGHLSMRAKETNTHMVVSDVVSDLVRAFGTRRRDRNEASAM
jgi:hypothetical protein